MELVVVIIAPVAVYILYLLYMVLVHDGSPDSTWGSTWTATLDEDGNIISVVDEHGNEVKDFE